MDPMISTYDKGHDVDDNWSNPVRSCTERTVKGSHLPQDKVVARRGTLISSCDALFRLQERKI